MSDLVLDPTQFAKHVLAFLKVKNVFPVVVTCDVRSVSISEVREGKNKKVTEYHPSFAYLLLGVVTTVLDNRPA